MSVKSIKLLIGIFLLSAVTFFIVKDDKKSKSAIITAVVTANELSSLETFSLEQGEKSISFQRSNGDWLISSVGGYPADRARINSFFLKLSAIDRSQSLAGAEANLAELGLSKESVSQGQGVKVTLGDTDGGKAIYFGHSRSSADGVNPLLARGQYVKLEGQNEPFLIAEPINVAADINGWIQPTIANILASSVVRIRQYQGGKIDKGDLLYELRLINDQLVLSDGIVEGSSYDDINLNLIRGALENLRLITVQPESYIKDQELEPLFVTQFGLDNGLLYQVNSYKKGTDHFISLRTKFNRRLKDQYANKNQEASAGGDNGHTSKAHEPMVKEAEALNAKYGPWVYKIDEYIAEKFLMSRDKFVVTEKNS